VALGGARAGKLPVAPGEARAGKLPVAPGEARAGKLLVAAGDSLPVPNGDPRSNGNDPSGGAIAEFFQRALAEELSTADVFRITITSFLDAYNFDIRRLMKCCVHHLLPSGHIIPFCAYNVLYRDGHVPLPALRDAVADAAKAVTM
jgi:hypothetical protein